MNLFALKPLLAAQMDLWRLLILALVPVGAGILRKITEAREQAERAQARQAAGGTTAGSTAASRERVAQARCRLDRPAAQPPASPAARQSVPQRDRTVSRGSGTPPHSGEWAATGRSGLRYAGPAPSRPLVRPAKSDFDAGGPSPYGALPSAAGPKSPKPVPQATASKPADAAGGRDWPRKAPYRTIWGPRVRAHLNQYLESSRLSQKARAELGSAIDRAVRDHLGNTRTAIEDQDSPSSAKTGPPIASFLRNPGDVRTAILVNEILQRPKCLGRKP